MGKEKKEVSRGSKEFGYLLFKLLIHGLTIMMLYFLFDSLYISYDGYHFLYAGLTIFLILRLAALSIREGEAYKRGIPITEHLELLKKEEKKED